METHKETLEKIRKRRREFAEKKAAEKAEQENAQTNQISESANPEPDYMQLCRAYQKKYNVSLTEAMRHIEKIVPLAKPAYIAKVNSERETKNAPPLLEKVDGKDFRQMVEYLRLEHNMTTSQAHTYIDRQWPGLRLHYIEQCNT